MATMHATHEDALRVVRYSTVASAEDMERVAAYAYKHQVAAWHAGWAVAIHDDNNNATTCSCRFCEREGLTDRIEKAGRIAWSKAGREAREAGITELGEWVELARVAAVAAARTEARAILAGLEAARILYSK